VRELIDYLLNGVMPAPSATADARLAVS